MNDLNEQLASRKAFTLIELLVVIAIIGVLVGLLCRQCNGREAAKKSLYEQPEAVRAAFHNFADTNAERFPAQNGGTCCWTKGLNCKTQTMQTVEVFFLELCRSSKKPHEKNDVRLWRSYLRRCVSVVSLG